MNVDIGALSRKIAATGEVCREIETERRRLDSLVTQRLMMEKFSKSLAEHKHVAVNADGVLRRVGPLADKRMSYAAVNMTTVQFPDWRTGPIMAAIATADAVHSTIVREAVDREIEKIDKEILEATKSLHDVIESAWLRFSQKESAPGQSNIELAT